jgi:COP9 signalosome complex subunit 1
VQAYISNYTSHTKIYRLLFIAERNQGKPLELEALKLAADEVKQVRCYAVLLILLRLC